MDTGTPGELSIFYDGGCRVCSWEVDQYIEKDRRLHPRPRLKTIDIHDPSFQAERYGLDSARVRKFFHVLTADGKVLSGVDAFVEIWRVLDSPVSSFAARMGKVGWVHGVLRAGYRVFVEIRPYLPRKKGQPTCEDGLCSVDHPLRKEKK